MPIRWIEHGKQWLHDPDGVALANETQAQPDFWNRVASVGANCVPGTQVNSEPESRHGPDRLVGAGSQMTIGRPRLVANCKNQRNRSQEDSRLKTAAAIGQILQRLRADNRVADVVNRDWSLGR